MKTSLSIHRLPTERTYAVFHIDENCVSAAMAYISDLGQIYPIRYEERSLGTAPGTLPEPARLDTAIRDCWLSMQKSGLIEHKACILCPPLTGRAVKTDSATRSVAVDHRFARLRPGRPVIDGHTMRKLERALITENLPKGCMVCDLKATSYMLDGERPVHYPVKHDAEVLEVTAHRVFTDRDLLTTAITSLKDLGVKVDYLFSDYSASDGWVEHRDRDLGSTAVNLGLFRSALSFHKGDTLPYLGAASCGTDLVLDRVGRTLRLGRDEVRSALAANRELLESFHPAGVRPGEIPAQLELGDELLRAMGAASREAARELAHELVLQVDRILKPVPGDTRRMILVGDELLTMWALCVAGREIPHTEWVWPDSHQWMLSGAREQLVYSRSATDEISAPILGLLRTFTRVDERHPDLMEQNAALPAREAGEAAGSAIASAMQSVRDSCTSARLRLASSIASRKAQAEHRARFVSPNGSVPWLNH